MRGHGWCWFDGTNLPVAETATGGSSLGLMIGDPSGFKLALALGGIFASLTFLGLMDVSIVRPRRV